MTPSTDDTGTRPDESQAAERTSARKPRKRAGGNGAESSSQAAERARERGAEAAEHARTKIDEAADTVSRRAREGAEWAKDAYDSAEVEARLAARGASRLAREKAGAMRSFVDDNPLLVGAIGLASGIVIGALLPRRHDR